MSTSNDASNKTSTVYRFKFEEDIVNKLNAFALLHKHEDRKDFKENWEHWTKQNASMINEETQRLNALGYKGDVIDKMYKSVRYYFRKKPVAKTEPKARRKYVSINRDLLAAIDEHIKMGLSENNDFKPSNGFSEFYQTYEHRLIQPEIERIQNEFDMNKEDVENKIKKTYKNRYFIQIK
jgi:hypothetical protein